MTGFIATLFLSLAVLPAVAMAGGLSGVSPPDRKFVVGYTSLSDKDVFTTICKNDFIAMARSDPGLVIKSDDAGGDIIRQLDQIDRYIAQKVDAIIVVAVDYKGVVSGIERANKANIPVIALNIKAASGTFTYVGSQSVDAGRLQAEFMRTHLPPGARILYLQGTPGLPHTKERRQSFMDHLLGKRLDVRVLSVMAANYDRAEGRKVTEEWLRRLPKFDAIVAANDEMALGAIQALKAAGRLEGVLVAGIDGTADALLAIRNGEMSQSVFQDAREQARRAHGVLGMLRKGRTPPEEIVVPHEAIDKANVGKYMKRLPGSIAGP